MRRVAFVLLVVVAAVACDPVPVPQVSAGSGGDAVAVTAVLSQTPGRGWRWRTEDTGVTVDQGLQYFSSSTLAEADAVRVLGSNWPGSATDDFDTVTDAEEDGWHYVGSGGGEPAFGSGWANGETGAQKCAFRLREAGVVDLVGFVQTTTAVTAGVFTLPVGYRPSSRVNLPIARLDASAGLIKADVLTILTTGEVTVDYVGVYAAGDKFIFNASFFLTPAATA